MSKYEAKLRALQLGYKCAEGCFLNVNGHYKQPYFFKDESLSDYQTFIIDEKNFERLCDEDESFSALFESGAFVYLGYLVCINDEKYVIPSDDVLDDGYKLTIYALEHIDECCLKFNRSFKLNKCSGDYYDMCYLCKNVDSPSFREVRNVDVADREAKKKLATEMQKLRANGERVMSIFRELPNSFSGTLSAHMNRSKALNPKTGKMRKMTNTDLSMRTGYSTDYIGQLRKDGKGISLNAVCAICISLHLEPIFSEDLIRKSKISFSDDAEGYVAQTLIRNNYMDTLEDCNEKLIALGYKPWGGKSSEEKAQ